MMHSLVFAVPPLAPTGLANVVPTISNAVLSFLPAVPLVSIPAVFFLGFWFVQQFLYGLWRSEA